MSSYAEKKRSPAAVIREAMEREEKTTIWLSRQLGGRSRVSELLNGKREPSLREIKILRDVLGIPADDLIPRGQGITSETPIDFMKFPFREMKKRGWIDDIPKGKEMAEAIINELYQAAVCPNGITNAVAYRQTVVGHIRNDAHAARAWILGVRMAAKNMEANKPYVDLRHNPDFIREVARQSMKKKAPLHIVEFLSDRGIKLVIVPHLKKTHIDGAVFFMDGAPVIALTLRYDRIDAFWFTLLHEISHIILGHVSPDNAHTIMDDFEGAKESPDERAANELAASGMIPSPIWEKYAKLLDERSVVAMNTVAEELNIHPAIVAGQIRYRNKDYRTLSQHVGNRMVRKLFPEAFQM
jgi:HTH-type transcriptional regulator/antitoxin HigA